MKMLLLAWMLLLPAVPSPAFNAFSLATNSDPGLMPLGLSDLAWQDDPSALADSPAWDFSAASFTRHDNAFDDAGRHDSSVQQVQLSKGMADAGGLGLTWNQALTQWPWSSGSDVAAKALGFAYGWPMGSGFAGGLSLWQAMVSQGGQDDLSAGLVGAGARWAGRGQWAYASGLWSKDGSARPLNAGCGGDLGHRWNWAFTTRIEADGISDSVLLAGWGPLRFYHRSQRLEGVGFDYRWQRPTWTLEATVDVDPKDQLKIRGVYSWHGFWLQWVPATQSASESAGWRSWAAPPVAAAETATTSSGPPAIPDVDPAPAAPSPADMKAEPAAEQPAGE